MRMFSRMLAALALAGLSLATAASGAADKPLVIESGKIKQLPASTTLQVNASGTGAASINIPHGTAPTSPSNGDCWTTTSGLSCRINGATVGPYGTGSGSAIISKDEGSTLTSATSAFDFTGGGVTASNTGGAVTVNIPGSAGITAKDEGSTLTSALSSLDFVGSGVTATNTGGAVTVTVAGGGGGTTTNALTITNTGGASPGATFDGSAAKTIDYSTVGAAKTGAVTSSNLTMATAKMLGRSTASTGAIEEITVGSGLSLSGGTLTATGGGGGTVTLVQSKAVVGDTVLNSITLASAPTAGNIMILLGTHWTTSLTVSSGWNVLFNGPGSTDGEICLWKLVDATDAGSATVVPFTGGAAGQIGVLFEVNGALPFSGALDHFKETSASSKTLTGVSIKAGSLMVGYFGTLSANTAPSSVTNVTTLTTVTGTTTNASPRQITPFYYTFTGSGSRSSVSTYGGAVSQYGAAYVLTPA
jgi:hypothetical protein